MPKGKMLYHFETVDMKEAKRILGGTACICGNLPVALMEFGKKEDVIRKTWQLLEDCMPGAATFLTLTDVWRTAVRKSRNRHLPISQKSFMIGEEPVVRAENGQRVRRQINMAGINGRQNRPAKKEETNGKTGD